MSCWPPINLRPQRQMPNITVVSSCTTIAIDIIDDVQKTRNFQKILWNANYSVLVRTVTPNFA